MDKGGAKAERGYSGPTWGWWWKKYFITKHRSHQPMQDVLLCIVTKTFNVL